MAYVQDAKTIHNTLKWAIATLKGSEIESPEINADTLLAFVLSCDRTRLYTNQDGIIDNTDIDKYKKLIYKRAGHVPLQYITQKAEFMSLDFIVDERVLIPRPETEILVESVLKKAQSNDFTVKSLIIVEIGTGSGNIAISLAKYLKHASIYTNDISRDALTVAAANVQKHDVGKNVHLLHGDFFTAFHDFVEKEHIDFIVSNPPYVSELEWKNLEPELKDNEPWKALVGGKDGLCFYRKIIKEAVDWLRPGAYLVLEIGETQANTIIKLLKNEEQYGEIEILKDLQGKERVISAKKSNIT
ncbi:methylase of polypeptide chain release factors [Candidatus Scalindua japonica]|uniref:Release factor glutamine methyltransferase n=1 Tax=Candidatus Scalindua japonica TaxID=1284222 RepID=A0A286TVC0_9BACT|nr:peptide chain release factor N(5)-glutamine methyltransferase [Candidatus Scalindua japonica]GAX59785.1 methylase of polypeptide chain release factors [Candidatus Scalindua japonica]